MGRSPKSYGPTFGAGRWRSAFSSTASTPRRLTRSCWPSPPTIPSSASKRGRELQAWLGPRRRIKGAIDGGLRHIGEAQVVVPRVCPQAIEGFGHVDARSLEHDPFGLLNDHPAGERLGELFVHAL